MQEAWAWLPPPPTYVFGLGEQIAFQSIEFAVIALKSRYTKGRVTCGLKKYYTYASCTSSESLCWCVWASFERERNISLTGERPRQTFCITNGNLSSLPKTLFQAFQIYNICIYRDRKREEFPFFFCIESQMPPTQHMAREFAYL